MRMHGSLRLRFGGMFTHAPYLLTSDRSRDPQVTSLAGSAHSEELNRAGCHVFGPK
jgi:hypothetical protein